MKVDHITDTIGAGDGHCGAMMACLAKGMPPAEAIARANAAAAMLVTVKGGILSNEQFEAAGLL